MYFQRRTDIEQKTCGDFILDTRNHFFPQNEPAIIYTSGTHKTFCQLERITYAFQWPNDEAVLYQITPLVHPAQYYLHWLVVLLPGDAEGSAWSLVHPKQMFCPRAVAISLVKSRHQLTFPAAMNGDFCEPIWWLIYSNNAKKGLLINDPQLGNRILK